MAISFIANYVLFSPANSASFSSSKHPQLKLSANRNPTALTPCREICYLGFSLSNCYPAMPSPRLSLASAAAAAAAYSSVNSDVHEAIAREPSQEFKEGVIIRELQRGFLLKDQLLRPGKVKVSSGPGGHKAKAATMVDSTGNDEV